VWFGVVTMAALDPVRHPLLAGVTLGAQWVGTDEFPSCLEWADEHEAWLQFAERQGALGRYLTRLKGPKERRDETFSEIAVAYFFGVKCGLPILEWEPQGEAGKAGEFVVADASGQGIFIEVKSPGWEDEIAKAEGQGSPRLLQPKHIHAEARSTGPWASVRHAVRKAYPKMPTTLPTLLVIKDDLIVSLNDWGAHVMDVALYAPRLVGSTTGYSAEDGPFANRDFERLGGVAILTVDLPAQGMRYRLSCFENHFALASVAIPKGFLPGYPRFSGSP